MPSVSAKQERFMAAVAHGWKPDRVKPPPVAVAQEFNQADAAEGERKQPMDALHRWIRGK